MRMGWNGLQFFSCGEVACVMDLWLFVPLGLCPIWEASSGLLAARKPGLALTTPVLRMRVYLMKKRIVLVIASVMASLRFFSFIISKNKIPSQ